LQILGGQNLNEVLEFVSLAKRWVPYLRSTGIFAVALKADGHWWVRFGLTGFSGEEPIPAREPAYVETPSLRAIRSLTSLEPDTALAFLDKILTSPGNIDVKDIHARLQTTDVRSVHFSYERLYVAHRAGPRRIPTLQMRAMPPTGLPPSSVLDLELIACDTPYQNYAELLADFAAPVDLTDPQVPSLSELAIWPPAFIDEKSSSIGQGKLRIEVVVPLMLDTALIKVGVKAYPNNLPNQNRFSISGSEFSWITEEHSRRGLVEKDLPHTPIALTLLSFAGEFLMQWWVEDSDLSFNEQLQLHRMIDPANSFEKTFFSDKNEFEERVNLLIQLLGLKALKYGEIKPLTDAPDILATSAANHLYVIECTTGDINKSGKLHRLHERTKAIADASRQAPARFASIQPVVVTSLSRSETIAHWATAESFQIALICREDLDTLLQRVNVPPSPEDLLQLAISCIPSTRVDI
jgi:hypothetical protein